MRKFVSSLIVATSMVLAPTNNIMAINLEKVNETPILVAEVTEPHMYTSLTSLYFENDIEELQVATEEVVEETKAKYYFVKTSLNKRMTPDTVNEPIGWLAANEPVRGLTTLGNGWVLLEDNSYVNGKYLEEKLGMTDEEFAKATEDYNAMRAQRLKEAKEAREQAAKEKAILKQQQAAQVKAVSTAVETSSSSTVARNGITLSQDEIDLMARLVRAEAGGESYEGMVAVASVVLNRVSSSKFQDSVRGVIYAKNQFSPVANGSINKAASDVHYKAVKDAMVRDNTNGATFFYAPGLVDSNYMESLRTVATIGAHEFKVN